MTNVSVPCSFGPDDRQKLMYCSKSELLKLDEFSEDIQEVLNCDQVVCHWKAAKRHATITKNSVR